jgi:cullin 1
VQEAGLNAFRVTVFDKIKGDLTKAILAQINKDREGERVDTSLLKRVIDVYVEMGENALDLYETDFQQALLQSTREYYSGRAAAWINSDNVPTYLAKAEEMLIAEAARVQAFMHESTERHLLKVVETVLLADQQSRLIENEGSGMRTLLREEKRDDLARAYRLFSRIPEGLAPIARVVREHFQDIGLGVVRERESGRTPSATATAGAGAAAGKEDPSDPAFVQALLELHDKAKALVNTDFGGNTMFQKALKDAFEVFVNKEVASKFSNAEMIATYVDRILKSGGEKMSDARVCDSTSVWFASVAS